MNIKNLTQLSFVKELTLTDMKNMTKNELQIATATIANYVNRQANYIRKSGLLSPALMALDESTPTKLTSVGKNKKQLKRQIKIGQQFAKSTTRTKKAAEKFTKNVENKTGLKLDYKRQSNNYAKSKMFWEIVDFVRYDMPNSPWRKDKSTYLNERELFTKVSDFVNELNTKTFTNYSTSDVEAIARKVGM
jgi:hypothetical protein